MRVAIIDYGSGNLRSAAKAVERAGHESGLDCTVVVTAKADVAAAAVTGVAITRQGRRKIGGRLNQGTDPRGNPYIWIGTERDQDPSFRGSDLAAVLAGKISITPLGLDLTHAPTMAALKKVYS